MHRSQFLALALALVAMPLGGLPALAAPNPVTLTDGIAAGVVGSGSGAASFGTASIVVPGGTSVTYFVGATPALAGRTLEIWTRTRAGAWTEATSRTVAADGTMRYVTRITAWTAFQARYAGDNTTATSASHGRIASVTARGDGVIAIGCGEFEQWTTSDGRAVLRRTASVRAGAVLRVTLCSNASTGYRWDAPRTSARYLALLSHRVIVPTSGLIGAAGSEAWTFRALRSATTSLTLTYSRPWEGGEKATWSVVLAVRIVG